MPGALVQPVEERLRGRSALNARCVLAAARGVRLWKKAPRIPEVDVESLDLFDEHQDRAAGGSDLVATVARQALAPAAERLEFLLVQG